jgi:hypothetical protein
MTITQEHSMSDGILKFNEADPEVTRMAESAYEVVSQKSRGDVVFHEEIEEAFGIKRQTGKWGAAITRLKEITEERTGIVLIGFKDKGIGLRLPTAAEQAIDIPRREMRLGAKRLERRADQAMLVPRQELSPHQIVARARHVEGAKQQANRLRDTANRLAKLFKSPSDALSEAC